MTCIVGIKTPKGVLLGGDTQGSGGWDKRDRVDDKVFTLGASPAAVALGFTTSYRMGQILRFHLELPHIERDADLYHWAVTGFVPAARWALKAHGYTKITDNREESGTFLLAVRDRLFTIEGNFQVAESAAPYDACGCGENYAMGALHVLERMGLGPRRTLTTALQAAARWSNGVGSRFTFAETIA